MIPTSDAFRGKRVLVTGHTGFKGAWLSEWLLALGADVTGLALSPPTEPSLFDQLRLADRLHDRRWDIRDVDQVAEVIEQTRPDFVFHLAAQSLVREGYREPLATFETNTMGTINVLEAVRRAVDVCAVVVVTTDKCYENDGPETLFDEMSRLGGHDPYSASKAAAELAVAAYRESFFGGESAIAVATARAGNVIGGGDWAQERIVPDCVRAAVAGTAVALRHPQATRPWQHVVEPLWGYLQLAAALADRGRTKDVRRAFNFGPPLSEVHTVRELTDEFCAAWPCRLNEESGSTETGLKEAKHLRLDSSRAAMLLGWQPRWAFQTAVKRTAAWYRAASEPGFDAIAAVRADLDAYQAQATAVSNVT